MQKTKQNEDWLTPQVYQGHDEDKEENEIEHVLLSLKKSLKKEIAQQEQAKEAADNKGKFGKYRYLSGVIDGLKHASAIVDDYLASLWGM